MDYLGQTEMNGYYCCRLIALLNALRFHGVRTPPSTGPVWQYWVDRCGCRNEDNLVPGVILEEFGLCAREVPLTYEGISQALPVMIPLACPYEYAHWALVVKASKGIVDIANYKGHLSTTSVHSRGWEQLRMERGEKAYAIEIVDEIG